MSRYIALGAVMFTVGACAWRVGETLSSDTISMALGVLFGTLAGLPVAALVLSAERRDRPAGHAEPRPAEPPAIRRIEQPPTWRVVDGAPATRHAEEATWREMRAIRG